MKNDSYLLSIHNIIVYVTNREEITRESVYTNEAWRNLCKDPKIFNKEDFQRVWRDSILQSFNKDHEKVRLGCFLFELVALVVQFL